MNEFLKKIVDAQKKPTELELKKCLLGFGDETCDNEINIFCLFNSGHDKNKIKLPSCTKHYGMYVKIMMLHNFAKDIDEVCEDFDDVFQKTFGSTEVDRQSCVEFLKKMEPEMFYYGLDDDSIIERMKEYL